MSENQVFGQAEGGLFLERERSVMSEKLEIIFMQTRPIRSAAKKLI